MKYSSPYPFSLFTYFLIHEKQVHLTTHNPAGLTNYWNDSFITSIWDENIRDSRPSRRIIVLITLSLSTLQLLQVTRIHNWLRNCATSQRIVDSLSDDITGLFNCFKLPSSSMALGSTQPLTDKSTSYLHWGKERSVLKVDKFYILKIGLNCFVFVPSRPCDTVLY
jgi:hypothetical protein